MAARGTSASLDVTQGVIWRQLVSLFVPVLAGAVFQELYTLANTFIVGRYASLEALGAIQATATLTDLTISLTMGMGMGCSVIVSQYFGAGDDRRLRRCQQLPQKALKRNNARPERCLIDREFEENKIRLVTEDLFIRKQISVHRTHAGLRADKALCIISAFAQPRDCQLRICALVNSIAGKAHCHRAAQKADPQILFLHQ